MDRVFFLVLFDVSKEYVFDDTYEFLGTQSLKFPDCKSVIWECRSFKQFYDFKKNGKPFITGLGDGLGHRVV